jgi:hypothetical protein
VGLLRTKKTHPSIGGPCMCCEAIRDGENKSEAMHKKKAGNKCSYICLSIEALDSRPVNLKGQYDSRVQTQEVEAEGRNHALPWLLRKSS